MEGELSLSPFERFDSPSKVESITTQMHGTLAIRPLAVPEDGVGPAATEELVSANSTLACMVSPVPRRRFCTALIAFIFQSAQTVGDQLSDSLPSPPAVLFSLRLPGCLHQRIYLRNKVSVSRILAPLRNLRESLYKLVIGQAHQLL